MAIFIDMVQDYRNRYNLINCAQKVALLKGNEIMYLNSASCIKAAVSIIFQPIKMSYAGLIGVVLGRLQQKTTKPIFNVIKYLDKF